MYLSLSVFALPIFPDCFRELSFDVCILVIIRISLLIKIVHRLTSNEFMRMKNEHQNERTTIKFCAA